MRNKLFIFLVIFICSILFSLLIVAAQINFLEKRLDIRNLLPLLSQEKLELSYLDSAQLEYHTKVLQGMAPSPWQYRVLSEFLVEGFINVLIGLNFPHPIVNGFLLFRILQNILIFLLVALYYKKLGLNTYSILIGLSLLAWGATYSVYGSGLSFDTYSDIIFYLLAAIVILNRNYLWIIPITILAALNRETSGLIPFMLLADNIRFRAGIITSIKIIFIFAVSLLSYTVIFFGLRYIYGIHPQFIPYGKHFGLELFKYNLSRYMTLGFLVATLGILPFMAMAVIKKWPQTLKSFFWTIVPIWFLVHIFTGVWSEARLFLVPHILIFIPGALFGINKDS